MTVSTLILPLYNDYFYSYSTTLENLSVTLRFEWSARTEHFHFSVILKDGTILVEGQKLVPSFPIQTFAMYENGLTGVFFYTPISSSTEDSGAARLKSADNYILSYST